MLRKQLLFLLTLALFFPLFSTVSFAQENPVSSETAVMVDHDSTYVLPFPGMLPDNPLYFLKAFRDGVIGFLISDPLKKTEFDLLKADKKIAEAMFLVNQKQKEELALSSVEEGQRFFADAITQIQRAEESGMDTTALLSEMEASAQKHEEVLIDLSEESGNKTFEQYGKKAAEFKEKVTSIILEN